MIKIEQECYFFPLFSKDPVYKTNEQPSSCNITCDRCIKKNLLDFIEFRWLCKFFRQTSRVSWLNSAVKKSQCQVNVKGYCPNLTLVLIITCSMEKSVDLISKKEKHVWNQHLSVANSKCLQWTLALVKRFKKTINITFYCPKMHCKPHQRILQKKRMHGME